MAGNGLSSLSTKTNISCRCCLETMGSATRDRPKSLLLLVSECRTMIFFIKQSFKESNSGIEHAQLKRAGLCCEDGEPFKMICCEWNPRLHDYLQANGESDDET